LIAVAATATAAGVLWPVVGAASPSRPAGVTASATFTDATGDATNGGPDVTTVSVTDDASGKLTFSVSVPNRSALSDSDAVQAFFDTDKNPGTGGSGGFEYEVGWIQGQSLFMQWDGSQFAVQKPASFSASYKNGTATFSIGKADFGGATSFDFFVQTTVDTGDTVSDKAPNSGSWEFPVPAGGQPPPPPPPPPGSPPPPPSGTLKAAKFRVGTVHAGKHFTASMVVSVTATGLTVKTAVSCAAKLSRRTVPVVRKGSVLSGRASCTWAVPKNTKGKQIKGSITATYQGAKITKSFSARVRA
jgi:hypothetical protein